MLADLATERVGKSGSLAARLSPILRTSVGDLVRSMNCYYSNLIEGQDTHPIDIDQALSGALWSPTTPERPSGLGFPIDVVEHWFPELYPGL